MTRNFGTSQLALAVAAGLAVGAGLTYLIAHNTSSTASSAAFDDVCSEVISGTESRSALLRTIGSVQAISSYSSTSYPNDRYHSSCIVKADGKTPLVAIADLADSGDIEAWKKSLAANGDLGSASDRKEFPAGDKGKGISSSRTAAIYLKCTPAGSKLTIPLNLSITVSGISKAPSTRADIAQVALAFARYAQNSAHCTSPAALPAAPPSQLQG